MQKKKNSQVDGAEATQLSIKLKPLQTKTVILKRDLKCLTGEKNNPTHGMLPLHLLPPQLQPHHHRSSGRSEGVHVLVQSGSTQAWHRGPRRSASSVHC